MDTFGRIKIPNTSKRSMALLELLGQVRIGPARGGAGAGTLTAREASVVCKSVVSLLLPGETPEGSDGAEGGQPGEAAASGGFDSKGERAQIGLNDAVLPTTFPLDIDQEVMGVCALAKK